MSKPKVLIVGCGAVGLSQGYHLSTSADCTYLVRPGRKPAFLPPKHLYSYKDDELHTFSFYRVIESVSEVTGETFAFVLTTLDGHTSRSESGVATLRSVGDLLNEPQNDKCFLVYDAVGLDAEDHHAQTTRIASSRLFFAASMLAHQRTNKISVPSTATKELVAKADILYSYFSPNVGMLVFNTQPSLTKIFDNIYSVNGKFAIQRIPTFAAPWILLIGTLHFVAWNIDGFGPFERMRANRELWNLMMHAQSEILRLPRFGWTGWLVSFALTSWVTEMWQSTSVAGAKPLEYHEFNAFHHGGKVVKQDLEVLEDILREGEVSGIKMDALRDVVRRATKT